MCVVIYSACYGKYVAEYRQTNAELVSQKQGKEMHESPFKH